MHAQASRSWSLRPSPDAIYKWVFYLTAGLIFGSVWLRALFLYRDRPTLGAVSGLILAVVVLFALEPPLSLRLRHWFPVYLVLQCLLTASLLLGPDFPDYDYFALLFAAVGMQVMQHFSTRAGALWLGVFTLISAVPLVLFGGVFQGLALTLLYASINILLAAFALATRRAQLARAENQATAQALQAANQELRARAAQLEQLAVVRARHSLARDLHDSVTQTIFSLTLTTQSALLLQERDPAGLRAQLDRMEELAQGALAEMHQLISELRPEPAAAGGLEATLRRHLAERHLPQGLSVSLEVEGGQALSPAEEQGLFRIAQEALNNIVKHAQASQACLRLHLAEPLWMEIEDQGQGFEAPAAPRAGGGVGLASMRERALEIGWTLQLTTAPGAGTRVRVEKQTGGE